jgi:hypothetical protein
VLLRTPLVLDAALDLESALARLRNVPPETAVVVRHRDGVRVHLHTGRAVDLIQALASSTGNGAASLVDVLGLRERTPDDTIDVAEDHPLEGFSGVLMDGTAIVGVLEGPPPMAAASPPPDRNGPAAPPSDRSPPPAPPPPAAPPIPQPAPVPGGGRPTSAPGSFLRDLLGGLGGRSRGSTRGSGGEPPAAPPRPPGDDAPPRAPGGAAPSSGASGGRELHAHPLLRPDHDVVAPGARFDLTIGLASEAVEGVRGSRVGVRVPSGAAHVDLEVQVVADGFEAPAGWWFRLRVPVDDPDRARIAVPLVAAVDPTPRQCLIEAHFTHGGAPAGVAFCRVAVQPEGPPEDVASDGGDRPGSVAWRGADASAEILMDPAEAPPDLWIVVSRPQGNEASGRFVWSFHTPHDVELPRRPLPVELGEDARSFAGRVVRLVAENEGTPLVDEALAGLGRTIREVAPAELDEIVRRVAAVVGGPPAVLLQSAEALVPWELALLDDPPDPTAPAFLGAQTDLGRWLLGPRSIRVPPAREVRVERMAVVVGDYRSSRRLRLLPEAEVEGAELVARYAARRFTATAPELDALLGGGAQAPQLLHFACHGEVDPRDPAAGRIFLNDDQPLDPIHFLKVEIGEATEPFLFLNACQVGQAGDLLGDYAGFAGSCLRNHFRGFVAPFWSVDDTVARELALSFYEQAFGTPGHGPRSVGEVLRRLRARFPEDERVPPSTWLAYTFYGNPRLALRRAP